MPACLELLPGVTSSLFDELLRGELGRREDTAVTLENREARIQCLDDVAEIRRCRAGSAEGPRRYLRHHPERRNAQSAQQGFKTETEISLRRGQSALPDAQNGKGIANPFCDALLIEGGHI